MNIKIVKKVFKSFLLFILILPITHLFAETTQVRFAFCATDDVYNHQNPKLVLTGDGGTWSTGTVDLAKANRGKFFDYSYKDAKGKMGGNWGVLQFVADSKVQCEVTIVNGNSKSLYFPSSPVVIRSENCKGGAWKIDSTREDKYKVRVIVHNTPLCS